VRIVGEFFKFPKLFSQAPDNLFKGYNTLKKSRPLWCPLIKAINESQIMEIKAFVKGIY